MLLGDEVFERALYVHMGESFVGTEVVDIDDVN